MYRWSRRMRRRARGPRTRSALLRRPGSARPRPSVRRQKCPGAIAVRHPSPGITRYPGVSKSRIPVPRAIHERIPSHAGEIGPPAPSISRGVKKAPVIAEIARTIGIWRVAVGRAVALMVFLLFLVPLIERILLEILRDGGLIFVREVEPGGLLFRDLDSSCRTLYLRFAAEYRYCAVSISDFDSQMGSFAQPKRLPAEVQRELVVLARRKINVSCPLHHIHGRNSGARIAQRKLRKFDHRIRRKPQRTAVLELHFGTPLGAGFKLCALGDGQVQKSPLISLTGVTVNLHGAVHLAQAHNANLRIRKRRNGYQRTRQNG